MPFDLKFRFPWKTPLPEGVNEEDAESLGLKRSHIRELGPLALLALEVLQASTEPGSPNKSEKEKLSLLMESALPLWYRQRLAASCFRAEVLAEAPALWLDAEFFAFCLKSPRRACDVAKNRNLTLAQVRELESWTMSWLRDRPQEFCDSDEHLSITCTLIYAVRAGHALSPETLSQLYAWSLLRDIAEERARDKAISYNHRIQNRYPGMMIVGGREEIPVPCGITTERASTSASVLLSNRSTPAEWLLNIYRTQSGTSNVGGMDDLMLRHPSLKLEHFHEMLSIPTIAQYPTMLLRAPDKILSDSKIRAHIMSADRKLDKYELEILILSATDSTEAAQLLSSLRSLSEERAWQFFSSRRMDALRPTLPSTVLAPWLSSLDQKVREEAMRFLGEMAPRRLEGEQKASVSMLPKEEHR